LILLESALKPALLAQEKYVGIVGVGIVGVGIVGVGIIAPTLFNHLFIDLYVDCFEMVNELE
jgi:hypothetical protein